MKLIPTILLSAFLALPIAAQGCAGGDCVSACQEAQERDCTSITEDCGTFCDALFAIADKGGCNDQADAYDDCAGSADACSVDAECNSEKSAYSTCAAAYCFGNDSDADCDTVLNGF